MSNSTCPPVPTLSTFHHHFTTHKMSPSLKFRLTSQRIPPAAILFAAFIFGMCIDVGHAEICRKQNPSGGSEVFQCPRLFESKKKSWCCGSNSFDSHCCEWSDRAKEAGLALPFLQASFKYVVFGIATIVVVIGFLWALCCLASKQNLLRNNMFNHHRHQDHDHHHHNGYPRGPLAGAPFPPVPPYNAYPAPYTEYADQPPPYHQVYPNNGQPTNGTSPVAPTAPSVPLLSCEQKDTSLASSNGPTTIPPTTTIIPNGAAQPPFNPSYS